MRVLVAALLVLMVAMKPALAQEDPFGGLAVNDQGRAGARTTNPAPVSSPLATASANVSPSSPWSDSPAVGTQFLDGAGSTAANVVDMFVNPSQTFTRFGNVFRQPGTLLSSVGDWYSHLSQACRTGDYRTAARLAGEGLMTATVVGLGGALVYSLVRGATGVLSGARGAAPAAAKSGTLFRLVPVN